MYTDASLSDDGSSSSWDHGRGDAIEGHAALFGPLEERLVEHFWSSAAVS